MKLKAGIVLLGVMVAGAHAADLGATKETVVSLEQVESIVRSTQEQFWMLVPPAGGDRLYIHAKRTVYPADWKSKEWPKDLLKQLYAEMETVNGSLYPVYRITVIEARTGELLWYNSLDQLIWQTPAPPGYNEYLFAFLHFDVDSTEALGRTDLLWGRSSNVGAEILLLPESFMAAYEQDIALETQSLAFDEPMAMMSMPGTVTNMMLGIGTAESNGVEVGVFFPSGYTNPVRVYAATDLPAADWAAFTNINPAGISECVWTNGTAGNEARFWVAAERADADSDGLENGDEKFIYKTRADLADTDGDGIDDGDEIANGTNPLYADSDGDGMGDLAEVNLAASVAANGSGGVLVVVPETGWYHAVNPDLALVYLGE